MNRVQFFVLIGLSTLVALLIIASLVLQTQTSSTQALLARDQMALNQGNAARNDLQAIATAIYQNSLKTNDQGLRDLMVRQRITPPSTPAAASETPASPASSKP